MIAVAAAVACAWSAPATAAPECAAWVGEPDPLPTAGSIHALKARWAGLRAAELEHWAQSIESARPATAQRLRHHARCLLRPAASEEEAPAVAQPVRTFRPELSFAASRAEPEALPPGTGIAAVLGAPLAVPRPPPPGPSPSRLAEIDAILGRALQALDAARFDEAISSTDRVRSGLASYPATRVVRERRVQAEVLAATAAIALGQAEAAERSLRRAIDADPKLVLDPMTTSPKVVRALERVREHSEASP